MRIVNHNSYDKVVGEDDDLIFMAEGYKWILLNLAKRERWMDDPLVGSSTPAL